MLTISSNRNPQFINKPENCCRLIAYYKSTAVKYCESSKITLEKMHSPLQLFQRILRSASDAKNIFTSKLNILNFNEN